MLHGGVRVAEFWSRRVELQAFRRTLLVKNPDSNQVVIWGGSRHLGRSISKDFAVGRSIFSQKWVFFQNFRDISTKTPPRTTFYCIIINKFPKNFEPIAQNFCAAPSAPRKLPFPNLLPRIGGRGGQNFGIEASEMRLRRHLFKFFSMLSKESLTKMYL